MRTSQSHSLGRRGLTLIEVIVVVGILALLAAFFLPATRNVRGAARKMQCMNQLKQLGLALHNYHDTFINTMPPGYIYHIQSAVPESEESVPFSNGWGWTTMILPYIDASPLYNTFAVQTNLPNMMTGLATSSGPQVPSDESIDFVRPDFRCPFDPGPPTVNSLPDGLANKPCGRTNYFGVAGSAYLYSDRTAQPTSFCSNVASFATLPSPLAIGAPVPGALGMCLASENDPFYSSSTVPVVLTKNYGGVFGANSKCGIKDMTDGTSNIIMVGERYTPVNVSPLTTTVIGDGIWPGVSAIAAEYNALGEATHRINAGFTASNPRPPTTGFGSMHTGGAQFLMADGAVRFLSETIEISTYRKLSRIADRMEVGDF